MSDEENPYRSPASEEAGGSFAAPTGERRIEAYLVRRGIVLRQVRLSGAVEALVEYNGRGLGYETVRVNGEVALRQKNSGFGLVPHLDFDVPFGNARLPASLDVRGVFFIRALRLTVAGVVVYSEGKW